MQNTLKILGSPSLFSSIFFSKFREGLPSQGDLLDFTIPYFYALDCLQATLIEL